MPKFEWTAAIAKEWPNPWMYWLSLRPKQSRRSLSKAMGLRLTKLRALDGYEMTNVSALWVIEQFTQGEVTIQMWVKYSKRVAARIVRMRAGAKQELDYSNAKTKMWNKLRNKQMLARRRARKVVVALTADET